MTKQELKQAFYIDKEIKSKEEQLAELYALAEKANLYYTGDIQGKGGKKDRVGDVASKIADLKNDINKDIEKLVMVKRNIINAINQIDNPVYRMLLEKRYLLKKGWLKISFEMEYGLDYIYTLHRKAINNLEKKQSFTVKAMLLWH